MTERINVPNVESFLNTCAIYAVLLRSEIALGGSDVRTTTMNVNDQQHLCNVYSRLAKTKTA